MNPVTSKGSAPGKISNASAGRIKSASGPSVPVTGGSLAARKSAPIVNGK